MSRQKPDCDVPIAKTMVWQITLADRAAREQRERREMEATFLPPLLKREEYALAILRAVQENSERPLAELPPSPRRERVIAAFREQHIVVAFPRRAAVSQRKVTLENFPEVIGT